MVFSIASVYEIGDKVLIPNKKVRFGKTIADSYYVGRVTDIYINYGTSRVEYKVQVVINRSQRIVLRVKESDLEFDSSLERENKSRRNAAQKEKEA